MSSRRCCERPAPADVVSSTMPLSFSQIRQSFVISAHQPHPRRFHHHTFPSLFRSWLKTFLCMDTGTFRTALTDNRTAYRTFIIGFRFIFFLTFSLHCYSFSVPVASPFHFVLSGSHSSLSIPRSALHRSPPSKNTNLDWRHAQGLYETRTIHVFKQHDSSVRENVCNLSKKRKKSCFFGFSKKDVKNVKKQPLSHAASITGSRYR